MIDLPRAWTITTGSPSVIVASIDMGIRFDHPDIGPNLTNDGYDFVSQIGFDTPETFCDGGPSRRSTATATAPTPIRPTPTTSSSTTSSAAGITTRSATTASGPPGIIGAVGNDGVGVAGVNWNVKIRPIRVLDITGAGFELRHRAGRSLRRGTSGDRRERRDRAGADACADHQHESRRTVAEQHAAERCDRGERSGFADRRVGGQRRSGFHSSYPAAFAGVMGVRRRTWTARSPRTRMAGRSSPSSAPGGDFRFDDNGGGGVLGPGWNFATGKPTYLFGYGTSASAPYRVRHRGAAARANAHAHRDTTALDASSSSPRVPRALRAATCSAGESSTRTTV